jgi:Peptidase A4 family
MKRLSSAIAAVVVLAAPLAGIAQNAPHKLQPNEHALNLPGATTIDAPPTTFEPISASDEDLQYHGFAPRPNQNTEPMAYASWVKAMQHSKNRVAPSLEQTTIFHGPAKPQKLANPTAVEGNAALSQQPSNTYYSSNWSGYVDFSGATSYGSTSFYYIVNDLVVPVAQQKPGTCTGGWAWGSEWNGIDGWGSPDVLQAGVEFDAYCSGSTRSSYYSAWYEWYPYGEVRISSLPVTVGDDIFVEVWHTSSTQGYAYLVNENTNQYVEVGFTAYPGYPLRGNSAEWVVEAPTVGGSLATLTDYSFIPFWNAYAYTESSAFYDIATAYPVDMEVGTTIISAPIYIGPEGFVAEFF